MFDDLLSNLITCSALRSQRAEGVAFFKVAKSLYRIASVEYLGVNIPLTSRHQKFAHCLYCDTRVTHYMTDRCVSTGPIAKLLDTNLLEWKAHDWLAARDNGHEKQLAMTFPLRQQFGETAVFGITVETTPEWETRRQSVQSELRVLANYFHSHVLRINGHNSEHGILISARELDCLKWTAAGKTAWEASVILGISERTVRFHLNAAREKLDCATTTQAVAKAIAHQLIDVEFL